MIGGGRVYNEYDYLYHHGIKGQKWGVRRYQNEDGSLTSAGKKRYEKALGAKDSALSKANANRQKYQDRVKSIESAKDYKSYRKQKIEEDFGDDVKEDSKKFNKILNDLFEVNNIDEYYSKYERKSLKQSYKEFTKNYSNLIKEAKHDLERSDKIYTDISKLDVTSLSKRGVKKAVKKIYSDRSTY